MPESLLRQLSFETVLLAGAGFAILILLLSATLVGQRDNGGHLTLVDGMRWAALLTLGLAAAGAAWSLYRPWNMFRAETVFGGPSLLRPAAGGGGATGSLLPDGLRMATWLVGMLALLCVCAISLRGLVRFARDRTALTRRVLVVGHGERADRLREILRGRRYRRWEPVRASSDPYCLTMEALREQRIWAVVLACPFDACEEGHRLIEGKVNGIRVLDDAAFYEAHLGRIEIQSLTPERMLTSDGFHTSRLGAFAKRAIDLVVSSLLLLLTLPLLLLIAALIKLESPGPVLYREQRTGRAGVPFMLLKFRCMRHHPEAGRPGAAQPADPLSTRVGRAIRPLQLDELPELLNVLRGDMSMVGPHPERPQFVAQLTRVIPIYWHRSVVRPGLTGWAQVNIPWGPAVADTREKFAYDLYYVKHHSLSLDLLILLATVRVALFPEGRR